MKKCLSVVFELSMPGLQLNAATTDSQLIQAGKFRAAWIVRPENRSLELKLPAAPFIFFDKSFLK